MIGVTKKYFKLFDTNEKHKAVWILFLMVIGAAMESIGVTLIVPLLTVFSEEAGWDASWYARMISELFEVHNYKSYITVILVVLIFVYIIKNIYLLFQYYMEYSFIAANKYRIQSHLIRMYLNKSYKFYMDANTGEIIRIITQDVNQANTALSNVMLFYTEIIVSAALAITIVILSPLIALVVFLLLSVELLVISKVIKPIMRGYGKRQREEAARTNEWALQSINGIKMIKVSETEIFFRSRFCRHAKIVADSDKIYQTLGNAPRLVIEAFTVSGVLIMILGMILSGKEFSSVLPQLSAFVVAAVRVLPSMNRISQAISQVPFLEGGLDNIIKVIHDEEQDMIVEKEKLADNNIVTSKCLEMDEVTYTYPQSHQPVLKNANLKIPFGLSVGIVGASGAGKTTAMDILLGLLEPDSGVVNTDKQNIYADLKKWHKSIAYIPQQIFLTNGSIRDNVAFGISRDDIDERMIWNSLKEAQLEEYVKGLPEKLDTKVGEQGIRLSGGQRQRIGIARALYSNPSILFFDEATSALDADTEKSVMDSIYKLKGKKTMIIVAHRLSTIEMCDVVYKVEDGKFIKQ